MSQPKISVIIPVYNTSKYMDECLESVLTQTFKEFEVILVDDGSTDGVSPAKCDEYAAKDDRVIAVHKPNGGLISAWTEGVKRACADYLCFLDSDDWVDTDMLEKLYALTDPSFSDSEIISGNYIVEKNNERRKETQGLTPGIYTGDSLDKIKENILGNEVRPITMSRCMKLTSRKLLLDNIKYCDTSIVMAEDVNIMLPTICDAKRLVIAKDSYFYHYRLVGDSMAHGYNKKLLSNLELNDKTFRAILRDKKISTSETQMDREFVIMLFVVMKSELRYNAPNVTSRVRSIFLRDDIRKKIMSTHVDISSKANKLLYFCMKHPVFPVVWATRFILLSYDKKTN
ncbi:glycosyltransferase family 2 protein [Butyrivibrio sp. M55]|uniref:glycosyltransferase family 2 protein n=1 Tax=Butyrivibrio sp. M55 TaxID=1855323 RepID=UPI0008E9F77C|nr:glycosyltransferase family 2 protein [Butyrivibrio sp. M55]SFU93562.1 Glycosyl transferase family 2 [Butyrivibrio sp. M55]